ncbi:methyl-accepting chemotaxis protein [Hydrogenophaga soli]
MNFQNLRISTLLTATLALLSALLCAVVGVAVLQMKSMNDGTLDITEHWLPGVEQVAAMRYGLSALRTQETQHVLNTDDGSMANVEKAIGETLAAFETGHQAFVQTLRTDEDRARHDAFATELQRYLTTSRQIVDMSTKREKFSARKLLEGESKKQFEQVNAALQRLTELSHQGAQQASTNSAAAYASAKGTLLGVLALCLALAVGAGVWLVRAVSGPLNQAVQVARQIAQGDLSQTVTVTSSNETGQLLSALKDMQESLVNVVGQVRDGSELVATASAEIAQGNHNLSARTEQQASALQQTTASMEELGGMVHQNAESAVQANQLARTASEVAHQGGQVVGEVVQTMRGISEASRQIADIIGLIDGIAFQTNILALNAAVEAARAGEQGRGFAVVASEVRSLAQRSAAAAKDIKELIDVSVTRVEQGTALVDRAGHTMEEVVSAIQRVSQIVGEISSASSQQATGVAQVGEAIGQMDQTTQHNAAMVEEISAAAASLRTQAQDLVDAVSVFRLAAR